MIVVYNAKVIELDIFLYEHRHQQMRCYCLLFFETARARFCCLLSSDEYDHNWRFFVVVVVVNDRHIWNVIFFHSFSRYSVCLSFAVIGAVRRLDISPKLITTLIMTMRMISELFAHSLFFFALQILYVCIFIFINCNWSDQSNNYYTDLDVASFHSIYLSLFQWWLVFWRIRWQSVLLRSRIVAGVFST